MRSQILVTKVLVFLLAATFPLVAAADSPDDWVDANTEFALDLYKQLGQEPGNLFFSPLSISIALGMTYEGARSLTAEQMASVLHFPTGGNPGAGLGKLLEDLPLDGQNGGCRLSLANRLWGDRGFELRPEFLAVNRDAYGAPLQQLDFAQDPEGARLAINAWVAEQTRDMIKDLLQPGDITRATPLVLTNAIYFFGPWAQAFSSEKTRPAPFHLAADRAVEVPTMFRKGRFQHASWAEVDLLQLPYTGGDLGLVVLLPQQKDGLTALESRLDFDQLQRWLEQLQEQEVNVALPRFKFTARFDLNKVLGALGMIEAFEKRADFSGMTDHRPLWIDKVIHQACVEVSEEGTEAAAATAVTMKKASYQPGRTFRVDHPFLFLIRDLRSGSVLFMGRVADPRG